MFASVRLFVRERHKFLKRLSWNLVILWIGLLMCKEHIECWGWSCSKWPNGSHIRFLL